jgi:hypothetical protein
MRLLFCSFWRLILLRCWRKELGPAWFDLAGSGILVIGVLFGGWIIAETARRRSGGLAARRSFHPAA